MKPKPQMRAYSEKVAPIILERMAKLGLSARKVSIEASGHDGMIRDLKSGRVPTTDRFARLLEVLGLELQIVDPEQGRRTPIREENSIFSSVALPHRGLARCGVSGWGRPEARDPLPAPANLNDSEAFYVQATGPSMVPEGIQPGDTVLVSPNTEFKVGDRVYIEDREGRGSIKRVAGRNKKLVELRGWIPKDGGYQDFVDERQLDYVTVIAPVTAVFERKPEVGELEQRRSDPRAPREALGSVPLLGYAAAGNDIVFDQALDDGSRVVPPPAGSSGLGAIGVRGSSYAPMARDGDTIYIDISRPFAPVDCIGRPVIARVRDGGTYLKTLRRGDDGKRWNLESADRQFETMTNMDLEQVFPVRWIALSSSA